MAARRIVSLSDFVSQEETLPSQGERGGERAILGYTERRGRSRIVENNSSRCSRSSARVPSFRTTA